MMAEQKDPLPSGVAVEDDTAKEPPFLQPQRRVLTLAFLGYPRRVLGGRERTKVHDATGRLRIRRHEVLPPAVFATREPEPERVVVGDELAHDCPELCGVERVPHLQQVGL